MLVFRAFSHLAEARVIAILLPPFCVAARGLNVAIGKRANPHIGPGGWDREHLDSLQHVRLGEPRPVGPCVGESRSCLLAANTGPVGGNISQAGQIRRDLQSSVCYPVTLSAKECP